MKIIPVLLGGSGTLLSPHTPSVVSILKDEIQHRIAYLSTLVQQAYDAQVDFKKVPSASTAIGYAQSYGHYLDSHVEGSNGIDTYPLMIFINHEKHTYMIYSDTIKDWFTIGYEGEDRIIHTLDTFGSYGKAGVFQFISDGSSYLFDSIFQKPVITDMGDHTIVDYSVYERDRYTLQSGVHIFH